MLESGTYNKFRTGEWVMRGRSWILLEEVSVEHNQ